MGLALIVELLGKREAPLLSGGEVDNLWDKTWSHEQHQRGRRLWPDCLLLAQIARPEELPELALLPAAEAAFAATWAALSLTEEPEHKGCQLVAELLGEDAHFLSTIKNDEMDNAIEVLKDELLLFQADDGGRSTAWAWKIGAWLQRVCHLPQGLEFKDLVELGWPFASFGLGFWGQEEVQYRRGDQFFKLTQPFERKDAFALLGEFDVPSEISAPAGALSVTFACSAPTKGLKEPPLWKYEALLGALSGVHLTQTGYVHKQFDAPEMPEWLEAIRVFFHPGQVNLSKVLETLWNEPEARSDLVFLESHPAMLEADLAFRAWQRENRCYGLPREVDIRTFQWFEVAESKLQKSHLRDSRALNQAFRGVDLRKSLLATKVNAFLGGYGTDNDVVLESARHGLTAQSTYILRTLRKFVRWC